MEVLSVTKEQPALPEGNLSILLSKDGGVIPDERNQKLEMKKKKGRLVQRNYVLNDVAALKKKMKAEKKKLDFAIGKEARDGSNITVPMKASFFEFVKANFIRNIEENGNILKVENA